MQKKPKWATDKVRRVGRRTKVAKRAPAFAVEALGSTLKMIADMDPADLATLNAIWQDALGNINLNAPALAGGGFPPAPMPVPMPYVPVSPAEKCSLAAVVLDHLTAAGERAGILGWSVVAEQCEELAARVSGFAVAEFHVSTPLDAPPADLCTPTTSQEPTE